jgi:hypothetical protein
LASCMPGRHSPTKLLPSPPNCSPAPGGVFRLNHRIGWKKTQ